MPPQARHDRKLEDDADRNGTTRDQPTRGRDRSRIALRSIRATSLNLDLGPELHDLLGRHAEEGGGAFGVALQEGKQRFPP